MNHTNSDDDSASTAASTREHPSGPGGGRLSRRHVLSTGGTALVVGLAGCFDGGGTGTSSPTGNMTPPPGSVFEEFSFEVRGDKFAAATDLVVRLQSDHQLDTVNLIGPDGSLFASSTVATGARTVRLEVLAVRTMSSYSHYSVGEHTLVGAREGEEQTALPIDLRPVLDVTAIVPHKEEVGNERQFFGNVAVTIKNRGTAPTWIYQLDFPDAPNASPEQSDGPAHLEIIQPATVTEMILAPEDRREFVPLNKQPFQFRQADDTTSEQLCDGQTVVTPTVVYTPVGMVSQTVEARFAGEASHRFAVDEKYVCTETTFELVEETGGVPNA